jgi:UDP-N-acetylmuramate-alanine ligase
VRFVAELADVPEVLMPDLRERDVVLTLGAGNVWRVGDALLTLLSRQRPVMLH